MKTGYLFGFALILMLSVVSANGASAESYCMKGMCYESDDVLVAEKSFGGNVPSEIFLFRSETLSFLDLSQLSSGVARNSTGALLSAYGEGLITGEGGKFVSTEIGEDCVVIEALFGTLSLKYRFCGVWSEDKKILRIVTTSEKALPEK